MSKLLLDRRAFVDIVHWSHATPMHYAAVNGHASMIKYLLESRANLNAANSSLRTASMIAAFENRPVSLKILIEGGVDVQMQDTYHHTALHDVAESGSLKVFALLITTTTGWDLGAPNTLRETVISLALHCDTVDLLISLLNFAPSPDTYTPRQSNALTAAVRNTFLYSGSCSDDCPRIL